MPRFQRREDIAKLIEENALEDKGDLAATARPSLFLVVGSGPHQLGGLPRLPARVPWPTREALPHIEIVRERYPFFAEDWGRACALNFVATIDCAAAKESAGEAWGPLPTTGYLHVFWNRAGALGQSRRNTAVIHVEGLGDPRPAPEEVATFATFAETRFETELAWSVRRSAFWETFDDDEMYQRGIQLDNVERDLEADRMLGWEWPIQDEAFLSAIDEHVGRSDIPAVWPKFEVEHLAHYHEWVLLLQLNLDARGLLPGTLYVYVSASDVAASRFDRAYGIYQQT